MESTNSRSWDRAEKLRTQLDSLKKEINVANAFLQEILDRNLKIVEELESVTVTQIYLREYTKVQKFLLKHINFVTEVNCNLEILTSDDLPMLNFLSGPQYSVEFSLHNDSSDNKQVFQFSADKKISNLDYGVNQEKVISLNNIEERTKITKTSVPENKVPEQAKDENPKSDFQSVKKKVLDPIAWTEAPEFVPKQASGLVKAAEDKNSNERAASTVSSQLNITSSPPVSNIEKTTMAPPSFQNVAAAPAVSSSAACIAPTPAIPTASASPLYTVQPQPSLYQYQIFYPRLGVQSSPVPSHVSMQSVPVNTPTNNPYNWNNPYAPKLPKAVIRNPIKIEAPPKSKYDKEKRPTPDQKSEPVEEVPEIKNQPAKTVPETKIEPAKNDFVIEKQKASEKVEEKESKDEEVLEKREETTETNKKTKSEPVNIASEERSVEAVEDVVEGFTEPIREMKICREPGTKYQVVFDHMVSPGEFYVQILCPEVSLMREMTKELEKFKNEKLPNRDYQSKTMKNSEKKNLGKKQIGRYGLCYTVDDPSWARVEIVDWHVEKDDDVVSVFFIDYGDTKNVSLSFVQPMPPKFRKYPKFAQQCHLAEIYPADCEVEDSEDLTLKWNEQTVTMFEILLESMSPDLSCQIVVCEHDGRYDEKSLPVRFFVTEDGNCVNDKLIEFDYAVEAKKSSLPSLMSDNLKKESADELEPAATEFLKPGEVIGIQVTCLVRLNKFYCVKEYGENEEKELLKFVSLMNEPETVKEMLMLMEPPEVNQLVIGKYEGDNLWYRARVTKSEPSLDRYKLLFLDYGNTQIVNFKNMRKMEKKFLNYPFQIIECYLSGIELIDDGKSEKPMQYFYEKVEEGELKIKIVSFKSEVTNSYEVILYDKEGEDIGADLVSKQFVKKT